MRRFAVLAVLFAVGGFTVPLPAAAGPIVTRGGAVNPPLGYSGVLLQAGAWTPQISDADVRAALAASAAVALPPHSGPYVSNVEVRVAPPVVSPAPFRVSVAKDDLRAALVRPTEHPTAALRVVEPLRLTPPIAPIRLQVCERPNCRPPSPPLRPLLVLPRACDEGDDDCRGDR